MYDFDYVKFLSDFFLFIFLVIFNEHRLIFKVYLDVI